MPELVVPVVPAGRMRSQAQPVLRVDELVLRPWRDSDSGALVQAYADPAIQQWHGRSLTPDEAMAWVTQRGSRWDGETGADWAVVAADGVVGRVSLGSVDLAAGVAEAGYWVVPDRRGRGIAGRSLRSMTDWTFHEIGLHRIALVHSVANEASCRVATSAGFAYEGTARGQALHPDGWHDMHLHARLETDVARS
jgi:RimJ/RimL family protein N-acetyltransferase